MAVWFASHGLASSSGVSRYVDLFIGIDGDGNTFPGPSLPFGMIKPGPDIDDSTANSGWKPEEDIQGFSQTREWLDWESEEEFRELFANLSQEHAPSTPTEILLVESLAEHFWLMQRAMRLQDRCPPSPGRV